MLVRRLHLVRLQSTELVQAKLCLEGAREEKRRKEKKREEKKRKEKKRKEKKRKEKKRKEKTTPFGVNLMRSQVVYRVAQISDSDSSCRGCLG